MPPRRKLNKDALELARQRLWPSKPADEPEPDPQSSDGPGWDAKTDSGLPDVDFPEFGRLDPEEGALVININLGDLDKFVTFDEPSEMDLLRALVATGVPVLVRALVITGMEASEELGHHFDDPTATELREMVKHRHLLAYPLTTGLAERWLATRGRVDGVPFTEESIARFETDDHDPDNEWWVRQRAEAMRAEAAEVRAVVEAGEAVLYDEYEAAARVLACLEAQAGGTCRDG